MTFRTKLVMFGLAIMAIPAVPALVFQAVRPWRELQSLTDRTETLIAGITATLDPQELARMNRFALDMSDRLLAADKGLTDEDHEKAAQFQAFNLLVSRGQLPAEQEILATFAEEKAGFRDYSYARLQEWYAFWEKQLQERTGLLEVFRKYNTALQAAHRNARQAGIEVSDIYIMLDMDARDSAYFRDNAAFIMESLGWWEASSPGEPYPLAEANAPDWRESYLPRIGGTPGFHHNRLASVKNGLMPDFDTDEWGTWFSGWTAIRSEMPGCGEVFNVITVDFNAEHVRRLMVAVAVQTGVVVIVLAGLLIIATRRLSLMLSRPIHALTRGAHAVMEGNYDHVVPVFSRDEFAELTGVFNRMIVWVREKVNLKDTLTKLLSAELADRAARDGLVLGGQEVDCTIMFTDFAGFSTLTRHMNAGEVVKILNAYFAELIPIIKKSGGFPDKFIGDAIVAMFGAPVILYDHAERAVRCAVEMQTRMREINEARRKNGQVVFEMRIGLNTGRVVAGAIGCDLKLEYTSIGETTTFANRMEAACLIGHVMLSEQTFAKVKDLDIKGMVPVAVRQKVKGYQDPVATYTVRVHDMLITKNNDATDPLRFYVYEPMPTSSPGP